MRLRAATGRLQDIVADCAVVMTPQFEKVTEKTLKRLDTATRGAVTTLRESGEFTGKLGETATLNRPTGLKVKRVILTGLGKEADILPDSFRSAIGVVSRSKALTSARRAAVFFDEYADERYFQAAAEGFLLGSFKLTEFKGKKEDKDKETPKLAELTLITPDQERLKPLKAAIERGRVVAEGQNLARTLASTPSNFKTPRVYAERIKETAQQYGVECQILDEKAIAKEGMGCLLAVAKGSAEPPRFVILRYNGAAKAEQPIALVGKGVTFDAGGISIKPAQDMHEMKGDMTGSAVMLATICCAAQLKLPLNLVGLLPLTENLPSGTATRPGDIVTSRKGLTVEIINTDAEGRLILADALDYANTLNPQAVIDIATLTGAALFVLGYAAAPVIGNNPQLMAQLKEASWATAERTWEMPLWDDYREAMKSSIADLVNSGGRPAGTLTASAFLENFIGNWPWAHIDIAYVDLEPKGRPYQQKGATGFGVRLLTHLLSNWRRPQ